jgi:cell division protein FtsI (penicillin-binding protein 3)
MVRASRVGLIHGAFVLFAAALIGRAAQVQLFQTDLWRTRARQQQVAASTIPAPRGMILDASGAMLVESRQLVRLNIAPREVAENKKKPEVGMQRLRDLAHALDRAGVKREWVMRASDTSRAWVTLPGKFLASDVTAITATRGVHAETVLERVPPATDGLRRLIGRADDIGEPIDGLEKALDGILRGEPGRAAILRDAKGVRFDSPAEAGADPKPGRTIMLTVNQSLQDIAERSLGDAVKEVGATGGDIVMLDPQTGEIRAMASRRADPFSTAATALTEPYEPGSTLKPFVAARLLDLGRARTDEMMNTYNGKWELNGRKIEDDHAAAAFSLADVIRYSSNIGIVQFAQRFSAREQYELLRDLGFGAQTGIPYPAEESGRLPSPPKWDKQTPASLAMGYALNVTPLQLAAAYAAIANGGELLEPSIVKEIRTADGSVTYRHERRVVRRIMTEETARTVRGLLRGVVEGGTAEAANLATFDVAGKTGTAKRAEHGHYLDGKYTASFVGIFPADRPQIVILVKLNDPQKSIYGGKAAAPVSRAVLLAAISAREASLDRRSLAAAPQRASRANAGPSAAQASADSVVRVAQSGSVPFVYRLGMAAKPARMLVTSHTVPNVRGLAVRNAVYALHRAGFRVSLGSLGAGAIGNTSSLRIGTGAASGTAPAAGTVAPAGTTVRLALEP